LGHPAARGDRPRPRGRLQPQADLELLGPARQARGVGIVHGRRRRNDHARSGRHQRRRRGQPGAKERAHRERHPARVHAGQAVVQALRRGTFRQRTSSKLPPQSLAAHDEHRATGWTTRSRGDHPFGQARRLRQALLGRTGQHLEWGLRVLADRVVPHRGRQARGAAQGCEPDRQRARRAYQGDHARQGLPALRRHLDLWQGRAVGARRRRHADRQDRSDHRRRDQGMSTYAVDKLKRIAEEACRLARKHGADAAEALVQGGAELSVKIRLGEPELVQEAASRALGLRVFRDRRAALTYTSDLSDAALDRFVAESVELAKLAEPDELNELPARAELATEQPDLELWDDAAVSVDAKGALDRCKTGEAAARGFSPKVTNSEGATYSRVVGASAFANSDGFGGGYRGTYQSLVVEPICDDADGKKRNGFWWTADRFLSRLQDPESVGREAARRTVAKLGSEKIDTGEMPVVFDPEAGRALLRALFSVISGGAIYRKSSYLLDREGTKLASPLVTIVDDPLIARGPGSRPYDGDGLPSRKNVV